MFFLFSLYFRFFCKQAKKKFSIVFNKSFIKSRIKVSTKVLLKLVHENASQYWTVVPANYVCLLCLFLKIYRVHIARRSRQAPSARKTFCRERTATDLIKLRLRAEVQPRSLGTACGRHKELSGHKANDCSDRAREARYHVARHS